MEIKPLSKQTLDDVVNLVNGVFPNQGFEPAWISLKGSLGMHPYDWLVHFVGRVPWLTYWVAKEEERVVGVVGHYAYKKDEHEASWIGWMCVHPDYRGRGIGRDLLYLVLEEAKRLGKPYLRLYTSTDPNEAVANIMYDKLGFVLFGEKKARPYTILFKQLKIN